MNIDKLKEYVLNLFERGYSINEIQKAIITNHDMVLTLDDVESLVSDSLSEQIAQIRAREEEVLKTLCEIKQRLVEKDCSPLHKESEALYQTIWTAIGEHYGWNKEDNEDLEDTQDQDESQDENQD